MAGIAFVGSVVSAFYSYANRNRELDIKLVEIGIGILRADPKDTGLTAARAWAVQIIEDNSRTKFSDADRASLLQKPLLFESSYETEIAATLREIARREKEDAQRQGRPAPPPPLFPREP